MSEAESVEELFNKKYITCSEIQAELKVSRTSVLSARRRGMLPHPIRINYISSYIWERETIQPYLDAWSISLASRRGELA